MKKVELLLFYSLILFLPIQLGRHFWPEFALLYGIRVDYLSPTVYVTDIVIFFLFACWLFRVFKKRSIVLNKQAIIYCLFITVLLVQILLSNNVLNGLYHLLKFLEFSFLAYYIARTSEISLQTTSSMLAVGVIGESLLAIAQYLNHGSIGGLLYFLGERTFNANTPGIANAEINGELILRPYGTFPHPNVLAGFLLISMLFIFFFLYKNKNKGFAAFALFLGSSAILLTLSRIAIALWILFIFGVFIWQIGKSIRRNKKQTLGVAISILMLAVTGWLIFSQTLIPRFSQTNVTEEAAVQRAELTQAAISLVIAHPIFGVGIGNFLPELARIRSPLSLGLYLQPVHNIFFLTAAQTGIIGLSLFIWLLLNTYKYLYKHKSLAMISILSAILLLGQFDHYLLTLQQGQLLFALVLGFSWARLKSTS